MTQNNGGQGDGDKEPTLEEMKGQIDNLNKGIASYRDKAQESEKVAAEANEKATKALKDAEDLRKELEGKKDTKDDKEVQLSPADQKKLAAWAEQNGFVTKAEMEAQKISLFQDSVKNVESQAVEEFLESHPEYSDKEKWDAVQKEFGQYKQPTSLTGYRTILNKIHREFSQSEEKAAEIRAKEEQKKRLGLGGSGNQKDDSEGQMTLEKLQEKYPRLSAQQIAERLTEINELSVARAKKVAAKKK